MLKNLKRLLKHPFITHKKIMFTYFSQINNIRSGLLVEQFTNVNRFFQMKSCIIF
ncbi:hypothetical protein KM92CIT3_200316 [uncultured Citrobacter sp.]|uniref:Uncharacterized protein n=1 Tax=uncultured Citrobacter sp. TaxID=200446 RepID=A0A212I7Y9_9ENTR|nr:hypothetical protein KM92CIT3_200316 [uncultured Citrobacter sp.]SBV67270.1 hypothetical protein KL86CIT2_530061 [uncultured Citrobacter sp.]